MPKVSVVMPVYNTQEDYLREAIESILKQTFSDFEFLILNDGSTENVKDVILSYKDERIRYYEFENMGISKIRNKGFELAQGEYLAVFDSDDVSLPRRFEKQVKILDENPDIGVCGSWYEIIPKHKIISHIEIPKYIDTIGASPICHPSAMLRLELFKRHNLKYNEDYKVAVDYELWSRAIKITNFYNIQEVLVRYRIHEENVSVIKRQQQLENTYKIRQEMINFLTANKDFQTKIYNMIFQDSQYKISFAQKIFSVRNEGDKKIIRILGLKIKINR